jgi:hypothetical protein
LGRNAAGKERRLAGQQFVHRRADRIDIIRGRAGFAKELLRAHIKQCAASRIPSGNPSDGVGDCPGDAEVRYLELAAAVDQEIRGLEVAMYDAHLGMRIMQACFITQIFDRRPILPDDLRQKLQCGLSLKRFITSKPDNAHSALSKLPLQHISAKEFLSWLELD